MPVPFILLTLSICAAWLPPVSILGWRFRIHPWAIVYVFAIATGVTHGVLQATAVVALLVLVVLTLWMLNARDKAMYWTAFTLLLLLCLALAMHKVPGFSNPVVVSGLQFTQDAKPFTQFLNFDKGSVGLVLLALVAPKVRRGDSLGRLTTETVVGLLLTAVVVFGVAVAAGYTRLDLKIPAYTASFLTINLFFTCVAEEAFFRTLVQDPLSGGRAGRLSTSAGEPQRARRHFAIVVSALLFGLVHAGGGALMVAVATLAGLGYAAVYAGTNRIEVPILVHFGLNATHFLVFTYPALRA